jgi:hypothetical protein
MPATQTRVGGVSNWVILCSSPILVEQRMGNKQEKGLNKGEEKQRKREGENASPKIRGESAPRGTG